MSSIYVVKQNYLVVIVIVKPTLQDVKFGLFSLYIIRIIRIIHMNNSNNSDSMVIIPNFA